MGKLVISGIGPLTPVGTGMHDYWQAIQSGKAGIKEINRFRSLPSAKGGGISETDIEGQVDDRRFRRAADVSKYVIAAIRLALADAKRDSLGGENSALIATATHGAINYTVEYHRLLVTGSVEDISPILFSESVLNAPAGNASICFNINGAVHTLVGGITAFAKAVILAHRMIEEGVIKRVMIVSAEELNELSYFCWSGFGQSLLSEGAGALLLEREEDRGAPDSYCRISGLASICGPGPLDKVFTRAVEKALAMAGVRMQDIDFMLVDIPPGFTAPLLGDIPSGSVTRHTGNAFCVSAAWNVMLASLMLRHGILPAGLSRSNEAVLSGKEMKNILVCNLEKRGEASAIILSRIKL